MRTDVYHPWRRQHRHQPRPPSPSFNDERAALACVCSPFAPRCFMCRCIGVLNWGIIFESFSLVCRMDDTADRRHTSINKPSRLFHTWAAIWNYLNWCYLNVINVIKACLLLHSICTNMHFPLSPTDAGMNIWISYGGLEGNSADW